MTPNFLINSHGRYFMLTNEVAKMLKVEELKDCQIFDNLQDFYTAVHKICPDVSDVNELYGSYIELWYDDEIDMIVVDHGWIDGEFDIEEFAQQISDFVGE